MAKTTIIKLITSNLQFILYNYVIQHSREFR